MRLVSTLVAVVFSLSLAAFPAHAQGRGNGQGKKQTPQTTKTKVDTPKATGQTKQAAKAETRTVKAAAKTERQAAKAETKAARAEAKAVRKGTASTTNVATNDVDPTTPPAYRLNPKQQERLQKMLGDIPIQEAMADFRTKGQFIAAVHVSNNLGIPFADLKAKMTGITPGSTEKTAPMSLGQAIQSWKLEHPEGATLTNTTIQTEVRRAEDAARADLR